MALKFARIERMIKLVNLTPHTLNIYDTKGEKLLLTLPPSGQIARYAMETNLAEEIKVGLVVVPLLEENGGEVEDLPKPKAGIIYVVSASVRQVLPKRVDIVSPGELIRDQDGRPIGCKGLIVNC